MVLPKHLTPDRLMRVVLAAVSRSQLLQECTVPSILQCVMTGAQLGLDCSGVLGQAYMVPFWNSKINAREATFIAGYRGLIDLARRSGDIARIEAHVVYKDDEFDIEYGLNPKLTHKPNFNVDPEDKNIIGAYMVAELKDGSRQCEFMTRKEIDKIRNFSKASSKGPWVDWFGEMCRKTVVRRGIKFLPMSIEVAEALERDDESMARLGGGMIDAALVDNDKPRGADALAERLKTPAKDPFGKPLQPSKVMTEEEAEALIQQRAAETRAAQQNQQTESSSTSADPSPAVSTAQAAKTQLPAESATIGGGAEEAEGQPHQEPEAPDDLADALSQPWDDVKMVLYSAAKDHGVKRSQFESGLSKHVKLALGKAGHEEQITLEARKAIFHAIKGQKFDFENGAITK